MVNQYMPYIWLLIFSSVITFFLGIVLLIGQRKSKGAFYFALGMIILTIWSLPNALEMMAETLQTKIFWGNIQYFAYCYCPITLVALCMHFTGYDQHIKNKKVLFLAILPTIIIILVWTNSYHELIRYNVYLDQSGPFPVIAKKYGMAFYIHAAYSYLLNTTAIILLVRALFIKKSIYFKQTVMLLIGSCLIMIPNLIYIFGLSPFPMDITPVFFGLAGVIILWSIFWYKMFELVPVARTLLMETMNIGFMVLDLEDKVMDMNPAFLKIFNILETQFYDIGIEKVCCKTPELVEACHKNLLHVELAVNHQDKSCTYEVLFNPLNDKKGNLIGKYAVVYEITDKKQAQQEYQKHQQALVRMEEKERLARDLHDNLGQLLGFINMQVQGINQELSNEGIDIVSGKLEQLIKVSQITHAEVRDYISEVRTSANLEQDFVNEVKNIMCLFEYQTGIKIELDNACNVSVEEVKPFIRINLLNIMKEALNNIRKHAEANKVQVTLQIMDHQLFVSIKDDGKGFISTCAGSSRGSFGLGIMKERAALIGGQIQIQSEIGNGTLVTVSVPLVEGRK